MRRALLAPLLLLLLAAPAQARWFAAEVVDGPAPITAIGEVSLGRTGTGGIAYIKQEGDNPVGYVARFRAGAWRAPERLPADGVSDIAAVAGDGGRLAVVWAAGGSVFGTVTNGGAFAAPVPLSTGAPASNLDIQIGVQGGAFAVWEQGGDIRAAQLVGTTWTPIAAPLDIVAAQAASAPKVAVAADDTAVVAWTERDGTGRTHVVYRRLLGTALSQYPQEASVDALGGEPGGNADSASIDVEYDRSFAWVAFRQDIGGRSRSLARRLRGSTFDPPLPIDGGATSTTPWLAMNPIGEGLMGAVPADNSVVGSVFADDEVSGSNRLDATPGGNPPEPVVSYSDRGVGALAYRSAAGVRARLIDEGKRLGEARVSRAASGPVVPGSLRIGGDRVGDVAVGMLQGSPGAVTLTAGLYDMAPSRPVASARTHFVNPRTEGIAWRRGLDYLGPQTFRVLVDGRQIASTTETRVRARRVREGRHRLRIVAVDRRGQRTSSRTYPMYVDVHRPRAQVSATRSGHLVRLSIATSDPGARGAGVRGYSVDWGDGHRTSSKRRALSHRYSSSARRKITVTVRDRARNETVKTLRR